MDPVWVLFIFIKPGIFDFSTKKCYSVIRKLLDPMIQQVISFFGEHFLLLMIVSAVIEVVVIVGLGIMFSQLRSQIKKLKKENSRFAHSVDFLVRAKSFNNFLVLKSEYEKLKEIGVTLPDQDFWREQLHIIADPLLVLQIEGLCQMIREKSSLLKPHEMLAWVNQVDEIILDAREYSSPNQVQLLKEKFKPVLNDLLQNVISYGGTASRHVSEMQKIKDRIFPELISSYGNSGGNIIWG